LDGPIQTLHDASTHAQLAGTSHRKACFVQVTENSGEGIYFYEVKVAFPGKKVQSQLIQNTCNINGTQASALNSNTATPIALFDEEELAGAWGGEQDQSVNTFNLNRDASGKLISVSQPGYFWHNSVCTINY
jgi:hypothetical protein